LLLLVELLLAELEDDGLPVKMFNTPVGDELLPGRKGLFLTAKSKASANDFMAGSTP
jgi:hypothetical protein